ncbi:hypothetical protein [uncultured Treponema sp.]|uniref:hypothetical protein n=1 Tax=uncultured Treponema sp. TaxID=162155 RepID=UPI002582D12A|nr:hypothetical protein [uncultured Treponema sp.]
MFRKVKIFVKEKDTCLTAKNTSSGENLFSCLFKILPMVLVVSISAFAFVLFLIFILKNFSPEIEKSRFMVSDKFSLLSGFIGSVVGAVISAAIVWKQLGENTCAISMQNQLELRKMFSEKRRWRIHLVIQELARLRIHAEKNKLKVIASEFKIDSAKLKNINTFEDEKKFLESILVKYEAELDDYLGLFEVAYVMLKNGNLDRNMFFESYSYRLNYIDIAGFISIKIKLEKGCWKLLQELIQENYVWCQTQ